MSEEFRNARREIELLKTMVCVIFCPLDLYLDAYMHSYMARIVRFMQDPFRAAEMALEIQVEKLHVQELITARAAVVARFVESCRSVKQKTAAIEKLTAEKTELEARLDRALGESGSETKLDDVKEIMRLETIMKDLRDEIQVLKSGNAANQRTDAPPLYEEDQILVSFSSPFEVYHLILVLVRTIWFAFFSSIFFDSGYVVTAELASLPNLAALIFPLSGSPPEPLHVSKSHKLP